MKTSPETCLMANNGSLIIQRPMVKANISVLKTKKINKTQNKNIAIKLLLMTFCYTNPSVPCSAIFIFILQQMATNIETPK